MAGPNLQINIGANVAGAIAGVTQLGQASEHAFDEIAAGKAAMDRITDSINKMAAAALNAGTDFDSLQSNIISTITPLDALDARLEEIRTAIGKAATVQGAANLGAQFEIINRNAQETKSRIEAATQAAIGLGNAFNTVVSAGTGLNRLSPAIKPVIDNLKLVPPAANAAASSLNRMKGAAGAGSVALTDFSRIVQDAPFGIVSIGNNITQFSDSLGRLRAQTGSVGGALKALGGSLLGPGGLGIAISLITTALTFASVGFGAWTRGLSGAKKAADDAKKSLEDFLQSLKTTDEVAKSAEGGVQGQVAQVQALARVVNDTNKAYEVRNRALQELQQTNKSYFGTLKLEDAATGALTQKVNEYTKALVAQSVVKGFTDEIGRLSKELFTQGLTTDKLRTKLGQLRNELAKAPETVINPRTGDLKENPALKRLRNEIEETTDAFNKQRDAQEKIATSRAQFISSLKKANEEALKFADISGTTTQNNKKEADALKKRIDALKELKDTIGLSTQQQREFVQLQIQLLQRDGVKLNFTPQEVKDQIDELLRTRFGREVQPSPITVPIIVQPKPVIDVAGAVLPGGIIPPNAFDGVINAVRKGAENAKQKIGEVSIDLKQFLQSSMVDAFSAIGEGIGEAFSGGGFDSIINSFLQAIGAAISALGKAAIAAGTAALLLKTTIEKFIISNPALIIAAGVAAVAIGKVIQNSFKSTKVPGFATGVTSFIGGTALVGENGPELVRLPGGSDVIPNSRIGDFTGNVFIATSVLRGEDIYTSYNRARGRRGRI